MNTLAEQVAAALRIASQAYAAGDQVAPCAVLWPDPERLWQSIMPELQTLLPELFVLGSYAAEKRTGQPRHTYALTPAGQASAMEILAASLTRKG